MTQQISRAKGWRFGVVAAAVGALMASSAALAQQSAGSINGRAAAGETITVENKAINISRQATVDSSGLWQLTQLPAGTYAVTVTRANGTKETATVVVVAGQGANAVFPSALQTVTITGTAIRSIDVSTPTSNYTISADEIDRIPVAQNVTAVTLLSPGASQGDGRLGGNAARSGNLASLGGASVAENAYYINGFNVTNISKGLAFNEVPFPAIGQLQVLNGGYGADFGRSLGGVVSVNTKRGTDEWKGGASISYEPEGLRGKSVYAERSGTTGSYNLVERPGTRQNVETNFYLGGPIIPDTLYVFGLIQRTKQDENVYGEFTNQYFKKSDPKYLLKVDWNVTKDNLLEFTTFSDKSKEFVDSYRAAAPYSTGNAGYIGQDTYQSGGQNVIGKWTSFITEDLTLSALVGQGKYSRNTRISASECPAVYDGRPPRTTLEYLGCWSEAAGIAVDDPSASDKRKAYRVDAEWTLGKHKLRFGLDNEEYTTIDGSRYSGGFYDRLFTLAAGASISGTGYTNTTGAAQDYVRRRVFENGGTFTTKNSAFYFEDNFQVTKDVLLNLGIRNESFENLNADKVPFIKVDNTWAPRGGIVWDVQGNGQSKVFTNFGRYYIPVYSNTNVRLSGNETFYTDFFAFDGTFSTDGQSVPGTGAQLGNRVVTSDGVSKDPRSIVDPNLKPMFQNEFIIGFQQAIGNGWSGGVKYTNRQLKSGVDDVCEGALSEEWALNNGYTAGQAAAIGSAIGNCFLYNPGSDLTANIDINGDGTLVPVRIPSSALLFPKAKRNYHAFEFTLDRQWDKQWSAQFSYVLAFSKGNTEGYVKSDNGQDDAGITQDFDHPGLAEGSEGYLPNDRRHSFKFNAAYQWSDEWRFGMTGIIQSGRPKNCFGNYAGNIVDDSPLYGASSFYCNGELSPRGSRGRLPWTRDFSVQAVYMPGWAKGLTLGVDVLNIFNERGVRAVDEAGELDSIGSVNPTFNRPLLSSLQRPRSVRLTAAYDF